MDFIIFMVNFLKNLVYMNADLNELKVIDSTFEENTSVLEGAVINVDTIGVLEIKNSKFKRNKSRG